MLLKRRPFERIACTPFIVQDMGNFYTSITLQTLNQQGIIEFLIGLGRSAYVLLPSKGYIVVYEAECDEQDIEVIASLTAKLSSQFDTVALTFLNHDDDILWYQLYSNGNLLDEYNSTPNYFDAEAPIEPTGGNAVKLCEVFRRPQSVKQVERILRSINYTFASERHQALTKTLGLPSIHAQIGYSEMQTEDEAANKSLFFVKSVERKWLRQFTNTGEVIRPFDLTKELRKLLRQNKKISAISLYQRSKRCTLKEARQFIESL
jgi:hypothetical protein